MNIIPWRKVDGPLAVESAFDDLWKGFSESFDRARYRLPAALQTMNYPPMNVTESENHLVVSVELPGMEVKDINIELMGDQLLISGERKWEEEKKGKEYRLVESQYGKFSRTLTLPENLRLERDSIEATFQKGILEIKLLKVEPTPSAKIPIKTK